MKFNFQTIGIGSLPYQNIEIAFEKTLKNFNIPFWNQLPSFSFKQNMYVQFAYDLPNAIIDEKNKKFFIKISGEEPIENFLKKLENANFNAFYKKEHFSGLYYLLEHKDKVKSEFVKGQITGIISLGLQVVDENRKPIIYNEIYKELLIKNLKMKIKLQEEKLKEIASTIIFLDEPYLSMIGSPYISLNKEEVVLLFNELLKEFKGLKGIHCCGNTDWEMVLQLPIDILSFDAYNYSQQFLLYSKEIKNFLENGKTIAWGIVPSDEKVRKESKEGLVLKLKNIFEILEKKGIKKELLRNSLISGSCGFGSLTLENCEKALNLTKEVAKEFKKS